MEQTNDTRQPDTDGIEMGNWQERSLLERRSGRDCRQKPSAAYFNSGGLERRTGKERRQADERRDRWLRVGKWRSELVFEE
ncbi:MAG: hypothetical protein JRE88_00940 [Deltaproteobacteria bacterium]|jgi:hypothetical protein|nr:hypothetical protein [Deltaproteobacteria bacterium]